MKPITIILERGLLSAVYADNRNTNIVIMDKDREGCAHQEPLGDARMPSVHLEVAEPYHLLPEDDVELLRKTFPYLQTCDLA